MEIRALRAEDDRGRFRSGDSDLDRFFHVYAGQNQFRHHIGTTYVAVEAGTICGYVTVAAGGLEIEDLPEALRRRLPSYPLPVLRLARLAVDGAFRGQGIGKELLAFALGLALRMRDDFGCVGVIVDAKPDAEAFYSRFGFQSLDVVEGAAGTRPLPVAMFLPVGEIDTAGRATGRTPRR